jgi:hypothetical protein
LTTQKTDNKTKLSEKKTLILLKLNPLQHQMPQNSIYIYIYTHTHKTQTLQIIFSKHKFLNKAAQKSRKSQTHKEKTIMSFKNPENFKTESFLEKRSSKTQKWLKLEYASQIYRDKHETPCSFGERKSVALIDPTATCQSLVVCRA